MAKVQYQRYITGVARMRKILRVFDALGIGYQVHPDPDIDTQRFTVDVPEEYEYLLSAVISNKVNLEALV